MQRSCKLTLKFATESKRRRISALLEAYRSAVNFYIQSLWNNPGNLNKETLSRLPDNHTRLSARYKSQALRQALKTVTATKKAAKTRKKPCSCPVFNGPAVLDSKFISIDDNNGCFDLMIKLSGLNKNHKIIIPTKKTAPLNKWLSKPGAELVQGASLSDNCLTVWIELSEPSKNSGDCLGIDIGVNKLIADSNGNHYGTEFKTIRDKILHHERGSKANSRALKHRDNFIQYTVNQLPWSNIKYIVIEDLKHLKTGKKKNRSKSFRKALAPWKYRQVIEAVTQKAQEYGVHLVTVPPAYTSRICPKCGKESESNRKDEIFKCTHCAYADDADTVGALNILSRSFHWTGA